MSNNKKVDLNSFSLDGKIFADGDFMATITSWDTQVIKEHISGHSIIHVALAYLRKFSDAQNWNTIMREAILNSLQDKHAVELAPLMKELRKTLSGKKGKKRKPKVTLQETPLTLKDVESLLARSSTAKGKEDNNPPERQKTVATYKPLRTYIWAALNLSTSWFDDFFKGDKNLANLKWFDCTPYFMNFNAKYTELPLTAFLKQVTTNMVKSKSALEQLVKNLSAYQIDVTVGTAAIGGFDANYYRSLKEHYLKNTQRESVNIPFKTKVEEKELSNDQTAIEKLVLKRRALIEPKNKITNN